MDAYPFPTLGCRGSYVIFSLVNIVTLLFRVTIMRWRDVPIITANITIAASIGILDRFATLFAETGLARIVGLAGARSATLATLRPYDVTTILIVVIANCGRVAVGPSIDAVRIPRS